MSRSRFVVRRLLPVAGIALLASLLGNSLAFANHSFSDVSDSHPFHEEISAIRQAGITNGYGDGTYRPAEPVSRAAMAAFMGRGFGRINTAGGSISNPADNTPTQVGVAVMKSGATSGAGGYVHLTADAQMSAPVTECQCVLTVEIYDQATSTVVGSRTSMSDDVNVLLINSQSVAVQALVEIPPNVTRAYTLRVRATTAGNNSGITVSGRIVASYVPFDYLGNQSS